MLVHIDKECDAQGHGDFVPRKLHEDSYPSERRRSVEIPDELVVRYEKAVHEHEEVQDLLQEIHDDQDWPRFMTDEEHQIDKDHFNKMQRAIADSETKLL